MAGQIRHIYTNPQADATNTNIVRPSDWNSVHAYTLPDGISAGTQLMSSGTVVFANSNGISFGMSQSSQITASYTVPSVAGLLSNINVSAGTTSQHLSALTFSNLNGISFGLNGSVITGSHNAITTGALSDHSHGNPTLALTNLSGTTASASNGFTLSLSAGPGGAGDGVNILAAGTQTANTTGTVLFNNANGLSFGMSNSSVITGSYTVPSVTEYFSKTNTTFSGTNISGSLTLNTDGLRVDLSVGAGGAGDGVNILAAGTQTANTTGTVLFNNANGISFGMANSSVITASYTVPSTAGLLSAVNVSAGTTSNNLSAMTFANSNGMSFGLNGSVVTGTVKTDYLTTAALSNHSHGVSFTSGSVAFQTLSFTNSNGISFNSGTQGIFASHNALTTAAQSDHSHGNPTLALTNLSGTTASASNGFTLSLSAAAAGGVNPAASASNGSFAFTTLNFSNANNVTFGTSAGGIITASVAAPGAAAENNWVNLLGANTAGNTTASGSTIGYSGINLTLSGTNGSVVNISAPATSSLVGTNGISISTNGSTISVSYVGTTYNNWEVFPMGNNTTFSSLGQNSLYLQKIRPENAYSFNYFEPRISGSFVSSTNSQVAVHSISYGLYSRDNATRVTQCGSSVMVISASYNSNTAMGYTISQGGASYTTTSGGTAIASLMTGFKHLYLPFTTTMSAGTEYWFAMNISSATTVGTGPHRMAVLHLTNINNLTVGKVHATTILASNTSHVGDYNQGVYSATTGALPSTIADNQITNAISQARMYLQVDA